MAAPKRELFKAADVCELAGLQPYVLRSWEAEFPGLGQAGAGGGPRVYGRPDVELVLRIKQLVFGEGLTLAGARRRLEEEPEPDAPVAVPDVLGGAARERLKAIRGGLTEILELLGRDPAAPELTLVSPSSGRTNGKGGKDVRPARSAGKRRQANA